MNAAKVHSRAERSSVPERHLSALFSGTFRLHKKFTSYSGDTNEQLVWSPDGKEIASGSGNNVAVWNAATGKQVYLFTKQGGHVRALAWSPDGKYIVSGSSNEAGGNHALVWLA